MQRCKVAVPENEHYVNVLGCEIIGSVLLVWNPDEDSLKSLIDVHNEQCRDAYREIAMLIMSTTTISKKKTKKLILDATCHIKRIDKYESISPCINHITIKKYNLPNVLCETR